METYLAERLGGFWGSGGIAPSELRAPEMLEVRKKWKEQKKPKLDKEIKQKREERNREKEKLQMAISTALDEWIGSEGWWK